MAVLKPGVKTSEFVVSLIAPTVALVGVVLAGFGISFDTAQVTAFAVAVGGAAVSSHGYSTSRAVVKAAVAATQPEFGTSAQGNLY